MFLSLPHSFVVQLLQHVKQLLAKGRRPRTVHMIFGLESYHRRYIFWRASLSSVCFLTFGITLTGPLLCRWMGSSPLRSKSKSNTDCSR